MFVSYPIYVNQMEKHIAIGVVCSRVVCVLYCVKVVRITNILRELGILLLHVTSAMKMKAGI
jgi:hypothetical protein